MLLMMSGGKLLSLNKEEREWEEWNNEIVTKPPSFHSFYSLVLSPYERCMREEGIYAKCTMGSPSAALI